jgi:hypothetical protein
VSTRGRSCGKPARWRAGARIKSSRGRGEERWSTPPPVAMATPFRCPNAGRRPFLCACNRPRGRSSSGPLVSLAFAGPGRASRTVIQRSSTCSSFPSSPQYSVSRGSWMDFFRPVPWDFRVPALPVPGAHNTRVAFVCS